MTALFSTAYLPPIDYMAALLRCGNVLIDVNETFPKQTYRNRAIIATAGGKRPLIVPVTRTDGNHTTTERMAVAYKERWNIVHLRTLEASYAASPYWIHYKDGLTDILTTHYNRLIDLNMDLLNWLLESLKASCGIALTDDFIRPNNEEWDYRHRFSPKRPSPIRQYPRYYQVFDATQEFAPNLSTIDLLMNMGPESLDYLKSLT